MKGSEYSVSGLIDIEMITVVHNVDN